MFNERDRRCAAVQPMLSSNPSYDNRTIASTLKIQIRTVQRAQGGENKVSGFGYGLWCGFKWGPHHATLHLRSRLESQHQSVPGYAEECGDPLGAIKWPVADTGCGSRTRHRPTSPKKLRLVFRRSSTTLYPSLTALSSLDLNPLDFFVLSYVEKITNMTSHNTKASLIAEYPPSIEAVIEAEGDYIE